MQQLTLACCCHRYVLFHQNPRCLYYHYGSSQSKWEAVIKLKRKWRTPVPSFSVSTLSRRQLLWGSCTMYALHQSFLWLWFLFSRLVFFLPVRHLCYSPKAEVIFNTERSSFFKFWNHFCKSSVFQANIEEIRSFSVLQRFIFCLIYTQRALLGSFVLPQEKSNWNCFICVVEA